MPKRFFKTLACRFNETYNSIDLHPMASLQWGSVSEIRTDDNYIDEIVCRASTCGETWGNDRMTEGEIWHRVQLHSAVVLLFSLKCIRLWQILTEYFTHAFLFFSRFHFAVRSQRCGFMQRSLAKKQRFARFSTSGSRESGNQLIGLVRHDKT